ncbi:hypothetical protein A0J61_03150 [Choanephora cucurbitarum]|uniref:Uncharacterized protein n=1 Tax=Choanephora cucurbitarum TaxID=101091 RepID=A0A1C7NNE9_9FUNG|nr:hypothetical protein A0J61_03150 [Choanephora cucurbitarum]
MQHTFQKIDCQQRSETESAFWSNTVFHVDLQHKFQAKFGKITLNLSKKRIEVAGNHDKFKETTIDSKEAYNFNYQP